MDTFLDQHAVYLIYRLHNILMREMSTKLLSKTSNIIHYNQIN